MTEYVRVNDFSARRTGVEVPADEDRCVRVEHGVRCPRRKRPAKPRGRTKYCEACLEEVTAISKARRYQEWKVSNRGVYLQRHREYARNRARRLAAAKDPAFMAWRQREKLRKRAQYRDIAKNYPELYEEMKAKQRERYYARMARKKKEAA